MRLESVFSDPIQKSLECVDFLTDDCGSPIALYTSCLALWSRIDVVSLETSTFSRCQSEFP